MAAVPLVAAARALRGAELSPERFAAHLELARCGYANFFASDEPLRHATYAATHLLEMRRWHVAEYLAVVDDAAACSHEALRPRTPRCSRAPSSEPWCGNTSPMTWRLQRARRWLPRLRPARRVAAAGTSRARAARGAAGSGAHARQPAEAAAKRHASADEENSAVEVYLQVGRDQRRNGAARAPRAGDRGAALPAAAHGGASPAAWWGCESSCRARSTTPPTRQPRRGLPCDGLAPPREDARRRVWAPPRDARRAACCDASLAAESARHWAQIDIGILDFSRGARDAAVLPRSRCMSRAWREYGALARRNAAGCFAGLRAAIRAAAAPLPARCLDGSRR